MTAAGGCGPSPRPPRRQAPVEIGDQAAPLAGSPTASATALTAPRTPQVLRLRHDHHAPAETLQQVDRAAHAERPGQDQVRIEPQHILGASMRERDAARLLGDGRHGRIGARCVTAAIRSRGTSSTSSWSVHRSSETMRRGASAARPA
jgi:hypothetical protein